MRAFALLCIVLGAASGCGGSHAVRVRCDRHLTPINGPVRAPLSDALHRVTSTLPATATRSVGP